MWQADSSQLGPDAATGGIPGLIDAFRVTGPIQTTGIYCPDRCKSNGMVLSDPTAAGPGHENRS